MGKRNRQRRQDKRRRQERARSYVGARGTAGSSDTFREPAAEGLDAARAQSLFVEGALGGRGTEPLRMLSAAWSSNDVVPIVAARCLERVLADAWPKGWQPADIRRLAARRLGGEHGRLVVHVMAAEAESYRNRPGADQAWLAQLDAMGARRSRPSGRPYLREWEEAESAAPISALICALDLFRLLYRLPRLHRTCIPPDEWDASAAFVAAEHSIDPKVLSRVRALLAKAESTTFPEEAEALTAKAQELIARHAIEAALLQGSDGKTPPAARRLSVDDPYASAKALLLSKVAEASRCRAVWNSELGFSIVFGFPGELQPVELLYTSLLVQATSAMVAEGKRPEQRRQRTRKFRQSFLVSFASRIGQRLREATAAVVSEASAAHGGALLPVLASRSEAVNDACAAAFPEISVTSPTASDHAGWIAGRVAADLASLAVGEALPGGTAP